MAIVQSYRSQQRTAPRPDAGRSQQRIDQVSAPQITAVPSPDALGAGLGDAIARVGTGLLAQHLDNQRAEAAAEAAEKIKANEVRVTAATTALQGRIMPYLHDPKAGVFNTDVGQRAIDLSSRAAQFFDETYGEISDGLANDGQRQAFALAAERHRQNFTNDVQVYESAQFKTYAAKATKDAIEIEGAQAVLNAGDPSRINQHLQAIDGELMKQRDQNGYDANWLKNETAVNHSQVWSAVIDRLLSQGDDLRAKAYFDFKKDEIRGKDRDQLEAKLSVAVTEGHAARAADELYVKLGPKSDRDPAELNVMVDAARAKYAESDPKLFKAIKDELTNRTNIWNDSVKQRDEAREAGVLGAVLQGATVEQLSSVPGYLDLSAKTQRDIKEHVVDRGYTLDQRAKSAADYLHNRAWESESRAHTRQSWTKERKDDGAYARYEEILSDPSGFVGMSENAIILELPTLGKTLMNDLLTKHRSMTSEGAVKTTFMDADIFNEVAADAGFPVNKPTKTDKEKATIGALRKYVNDIVDVEQRANKNTVLDRERKTQIMNDALVGVVIQRGKVVPYWFDTADVQKRVFEIAITDIPDSDRGKIEAGLRATGLPYTDRDIIEAFTEDRERSTK